MKVIFLDIDGVINLCLEKPDKEGKGQYRWSGLKSSRMDLLNQIVEKTDAVVVITSSWKYGKTFLQIHQAFKEAGFCGIMAGCTPNLAGKRWKVRGYEVLAWMMDGYEGYPGAKWELIEGFCMIDDGPWFSGVKALEERFVRVESAQGLTQKDVDRAVSAISLPWFPWGSEVGDG